MKTLNGYEVVDAKAREDIANIKLPTVPTKVSELDNDAGYIDSSALGDYAKQSDIPSLDGYATEQYVTDAIGGIEIPTGSSNSYFFDLSSITDSGIWLNLPSVCTEAAEAFVANGETDTVVYIKADNNFYSPAAAKYVSNKIFIYANERPKARTDKALDNGFSQFEVLKNTYNQWTVKKTAATNILITADYINSQDFATASEVQTLIDNSLGVIENGTY